MQNWIAEAAENLRAAHPGHEVWWVPRAVGKPAVTWHARRRGERQVVSAGSPGELADRLAGRELEDGPMDEDRQRYLASLYTGSPGYVARRQADGSWAAHLCQIGPDDWFWEGPVVATAASRDELPELTAKFEAELAAAGLLEPRG
jgi:hypothetical protein